MNFVVNVANKKATVVDAPVIICGNSDYVIDFTFDEEWDGYVEKTARFKFKKDGKKKYIDVLFSGTRCNVPILYNIDAVEIGVYSGNFCTTTGARVDCEKSILCGDVENEPYYEAGKQAEHEAFWSAALQNGKRTNYRYAFVTGTWNDKTFKPKYDIKPVDDATNMFWASEFTDMVALLESNGVVLDTSKITAPNSLFGGSKVTKVGEISMVGTSSLNSIFNLCYDLQHIEKLILKSDGSQTFSSVFTGNYKLTHLIVEGVIGKNGFNVQWASGLSHESLMSIINALQDKSADTSGTEWVVTIGNKNITKLTSEELNIAYNKGWEVY